MGEAGVEIIIDRPVEPVAARRFRRGAAAGEPRRIPCFLSPSLFFCSRSRRHRFSPGPGARDDGFHDLGCAVADLETKHVPKPLLHRPAVIAAVAVHEQTLMNGFIGEFRGPPLAHGGFRAVGRALVLEPERLKAEEPRGFDLGVEVGERMGDALEGGERLAERLPVGDLSPGLFQRGARPPTPAGR